MTRAQDDGSVTLWALAACVAIGLVGITITDAWRAISAWNRVANAADAAAVAGASGIDEDAFYVSDGETLQLDPALARQLADGSLTNQHDSTEIDTWTITATPEDITVTVHGTVDLPLLGAIRSDPITMTATGTADPRAG